MSVSAPASFIDCLEDFLKQQLSSDYRSACMDQTQAFFVDWKSGEQLHKPNTLELVNASTIYEKSVKRYLERDHFQHFLFVLYVGAELDEWQAEAGVNETDVGRIGQLLKDISRLVRPDRVLSTLKEQLRQCSQRVHVTVLKFLFRWARLAKTGISGLSMSATDREQLQQVEAEACVLLDAFFFLAGLHFLVCTCDPTFSRERQRAYSDWNHLIEGMKWRGKRQVFASALQNMLLDYKGTSTVPLSGTVILRLLIDVSRDDSQKHPLHLAELMRSIGSFDQCGLLDSQLCIEIADQLLLRTDTGHKQDLQLLLAFVSTYYYENQDVLQRCVNQLFQTRRNIDFKDCAAAVNDLVLCMCEMFYASNKPDHRESLQRVNVAFLTSWKMKCTPQVTPEVVLSCYEKWEHSRSFSIFILLKCFSDCGERLLLKFPRSTLPRFRPNNGRVCKHLARLLEVWYRYGQADTTNKWVTNVIDVFFRNVSFDGIPLPNVAFFRLLSLVGYLQQIPWRFVCVPNMFKTSDVTKMVYGHVTSHLLQEVPNVLKELPRCSESLESPDSLAKESLAEYCSYVSTLVKSAQRRQLSDDFVQSLCKKMCNVSGPTCAVAALLSAVYRGLKQVFREILDVLPAAAVLFQTMHDTLSSMRKGSSWYLELQNILTKAKKEINEVREKLAGLSFNEDDLRKMAKKKVQLNNLFDCFHLEVPLWRTETDFYHVKSELQFRGHLLSVLSVHPLRYSGVTSLLKEVDTKLHFSKATFAEIVTFQNMADAFLDPFKDRMLRDATIDMQQSVFSLLHHFASSRSDLFRNLCHLLSPPQYLQSKAHEDDPDEWYSVVDSWLQLVHKEFLKLLNHTMCLGTLMDACKFRDEIICEAKIEEEIRIMEKYPLYESVSGEREFITSCLKISGLAACASQVVDSLKHLEVFDEGDEDFLTLEMIGKEAKSMVNSSLDDVYRKCEKLLSVFDNVSMSCVQVLKTAKEYENVLNFFRQYDFHSSQGRKNFLDLQDNITMRTSLRTDSFLSDLLNAVIICHECVVPILERSALRSVVTKAKECNCVWSEAQDAMALVSANIADVRHMFEKELTSAQDAVCAKASDLVRHGSLVLSADALNYHEFPIALVTFLEVQSDEPRTQLSPEIVENFTDLHARDGRVRTVVKGEDISDFRLQLIFESSKQLPEDSRRNVDHCLEAVSAVRELEATLKSLVSLALPKVRYAGLSCGFNTKDICNLQDELEKQRSKWQESVLKLKSSQSGAAMIWRLFSTTDVARMTCLLEPLELSTDGKSHWLDKTTANDGDDAIAHFMAYPHAVMSVLQVDDEQFDTVRKRAFEVKRSSPIVQQNREESIVSVLEPLANLKDEILVPAKCCQCACPFFKEDLYSHKVLRFLLKVFLEAGQLPCFTQFLWCSSSTSLETLESFYEKVSSSPGLTFACVGVDRLRLQLRQKVERKQRVASSGRLLYVYVDVNPSTSFPGTLTMCNDLSVSVGDLKRMLTKLTASPIPDLVAVCGPPGSGKTKFIQTVSPDTSSSCSTVTLPINSVINYSNVIQRLYAIPSGATALIHIKLYEFTIAACEELNKLLFHLIVCGTLYDESSCQLFALTLDCRRRWKFVVEIPIRATSMKSLHADLEQSTPILCLFAKDVKYVREDEPLNIEGFGGVARCVQQLVQWPFKHKESLLSNKLFFSAKPRKPVSRTKDVEKLASALKELRQTQFTEKKCTSLNNLLEDNYLHVRDKTLVTFFLRLLAKRFQLFSEPVIIEYCKYDWASLPSELYDQFVEEAAFICQEDLPSSCSLCRVGFLNFSQEGLSFYPLYFQKTIPHRLRRLAADGEDELKALVAKEGESCKWEAHLGWMLNIPRHAVHVILRERRFVLTEEICYKMFMLHQKKCAGMNLILEGETGVGKTYLLETFFSLLNWKADTDRDSPHSLQLTTKVTKWFKDELLRLLPASEIKLTCPRALDAQNLQICLENEMFNDEELVTLWTGLAGILKSWNGEEGEVLYSHAAQEMASQIRIWYETCELLKSPPASVLRLLDKGSELTVSESSSLLRLFIQTPRQSLFRKLLVHPGLSQADVQRFLVDISELAKRLNPWEVSVFFDEINTSSCPGLFKEILIDGTCDGDKLPENLFVVAAVNPYTGTSIDQCTEPAAAETYRAEYHVLPLLEVMKKRLWRYGKFHTENLREYIRAKIELEKDVLGDMFSILSREDELKFFTSLLVSVLEFSCEKIGDRSVSQRDIKRFFNILPFVYKHGVPTDVANRFQVSLCVAIALTFCWRLPESPLEQRQRSRVTRKDFYKLMDSTLSSFKRKVENAVDDFVTRENFVIPEGVALTRGLKENVYAIVVCCLTNTPLAIVGAPGSSKSLSFSIAKTNLLGPRNSPKKFCRQFHGVDVFFHQCSETTQSGDIELTFAKAIRRQDQYHSLEKCDRTRCVVFIDEASLPKESNMALKALHPFLDEQRVAAVVLSNRPFDAAKANRMITIHRSHMPPRDLRTLCYECLGLDVNHVNGHERAVVEGLSHAFMEVTKSDKFKRFFHYRDFIHVLRFIHRHRKVRGGGRAGPLLLHSSLILRALEENMGGMAKSDFKELVEMFFSCLCSYTDMKDFSPPTDSEYRPTITVLKEMAAERIRECEEIWTGHYLAPRFVMIIDPTSDYSVARLLNDFSVWGKGCCKTIRMSDFLEDQGELHSLETLKSLRFALEEEGSVMLVNCKRIEGNLYELLNQTYRGGRSSTRLAAGYANIAIGGDICPCKVHHGFQCIVVLRLEDIARTPAPYLSRFAKFLVTPQDFFQLQIYSPDDRRRNLVEFWRRHCLTFIDGFGKECFVGLDEHGTVDTLLLSCLDSQDMSDDSEPLPCDLLENVSTVLQSYVRDSTDLSAAIVISKLLQLASADSIVLNFECSTPRFGELMAKLYCHVHEHFELRKVLENTIKSEALRKENTSARKLLLYCGTTRELLMFRHIPSSLSCGDLSSTLAVTDLSELKSRTNTVDFLWRFILSETKTIAVILIDSVLEADVGLICQLIDDADQIACRLKTASGRYLLGDRYMTLDRPVSCFKRFVLVLHFPPERRFSSRLLSSRFLNGWDSFFVDCGETVSRKALKAIASVCAPVQSEGNGDMDDAYTAAVYSLFRNSSLLDTCIDHFCNRVQVLKGLDTSVSDGGRQFYSSESSVSDRRKFVTEVFRRHPALLNALKRQFAAVCPLPAMRELLHRVALQVYRQQSFSSFPDLFFSHIAELAKKLFNRFLERLARDFGLVTLMEIEKPEEWQDDLALLLKLLPTDYGLRESTSCESFHFISCCTSTVFKTPLFPILSNRINDIAESLMIVVGSNEKIRQSLLEAIVSDPVLYPLVSRSTESFRFERSYVWDEVLLLCERGSKSKGNLDGVQVVCDYLFKDFALTVGDILSYLAVFLRQSGNDVLVLYNAIVAARPVLSGCIKADSFPQQRTGKSYCSAVNGKICQRFQETAYDIANGSSSSMSVRLWTTSFFRYCSSGASRKFLSGSKNASTRSSLQMLTAMYPVAVHAQHFWSKDRNRIVWQKFMGNGQEVVSDIRQSLKTLADVLTSEVHESVDRRLLFVQALLYLIDTLPESISSETGQDIVYFLEVLNGSAPEVNEVELSQRVRSYLFVKLWSQLKCPPALRCAWLEGIIQGDSQLTKEEFRLDHRYRPVGYPGRQSSYCCLRRPLADAYFSHLHNKTRNRSRHCVEVKEAAIPDEVPTEDMPMPDYKEDCMTPALDSIEGAVKEWQRVDDMVEKVASADEKNFEVGLELERKLLETVFRDRQTTDDQTVGQLTGTTLLFLERLTAKVGARNAAEIFEHCSNKFLRDAIGLSLSADTERWDVGSVYVPAIDKHLVLDDRIELLKGIRTAWGKFVDAFSRSRPGDYQNLKQFCTEWLSSHKSDRKQWQNVLKMFVAAQCRRIASKREDLEQSREVNTRKIISFTSMLDWMKEDVVVLEFATRPLSLLKAVGLSDDNGVVECFSSTHTVGMLRQLSDICMNHLLLTIGLGKQVSYFWNLLFCPLEAVGKFCFGGSTMHVDSVIRGAVRFDCCHMYESDGQPLSPPQYLSLYASQTVTLLTFASLLFGIVFQSITADAMCEKLLTREPYVDQTMGETLTEKVVNFCWIRVTQMFHWMRTSFGHSSDERTGLVIQHVMSRFAAEHTNGNELLAQYKDTRKRTVAEKCFQFKVFQPVLDLLESTESDLQEGSSLHAQLSTFRRQMPKTMNRQLFFQSLVNANPSLQSDSPVRTMNRFFTLLGMTHLLVPLGSLYQLIHFSLSGHVNRLDLDKPLVKVVEQYVKERCDVQERVEVWKIYKQGVEALNELLEAVEGYLHVNSGCGAARFDHVVGSVASFRYVISEQDPDVHDTLFRAMEELISAHNSVLDACKRYSDTTDNKQAASLLGMCDFDEVSPASLADIVQSNGAGIIHMPANEFEALVSACIVDEEPTHSSYVNIQFDQLETLMIQQFVVGTRMVSLGKSRKVFSFKSPADNTADTMAVPILPVHAVPNELLQPLDEQARIRIGEELSTRTYVGCMDLLEDLSDLISSFIVAVASGTDAAVIKLETVAEFARSKGHKLRCQGLSTSPMAAELQMGKIYYFHDTCLRYLKEHNFLHSELPQMLKAPLEPLVERDLCDALNRLSVVSPEDFIKSATDFLRVVHRNMSKVCDAIDQRMRDTLEGFLPSEINDIVQCLPNDILVRHCSAVLVRVLKAASEARSVVFSRRQGRLLDFHLAPSDDIDANVSCWYEVCLPRSDSKTIGFDAGTHQESKTNREDLVVEHAFRANLWKSWEWARCSILEFNIESAATGAIQPTPQLIVYDEAGEAKCYVLHGTQEEEQIYGDRSEVQQCLDSELCLLASRNGLVLRENEEPMQELEPTLQLKVNDEGDANVAAFTIDQDKTKGLIVEVKIEDDNSVRAAGKDESLLASDRTSSNVEGDVDQIPEDAKCEEGEPVTPGVIESEPQVERVHLYKYAEGEVCKVRVQILETKGITFKEDTSRMTLLKEGAVFLADFVKYRSVQDLTQTILAMCTREEESEAQGYQAVMYQSNGDILHATTALKDLDSANLENLYCCVECPLTYHCFNFCSVCESGVIKNSLVVPAFIRDFVSQKLRALFGNAKTGRNFYLWPPFSLESVQRLPRKISVIPGDCVTEVTFRLVSTAKSCKSGKDRCDLPALLTSKLDNVSSYAATLLSVDRPLNVSVLNGKPISVTMSVGCSLALGNGPQLLLASVPARPENWQLSLRWHKDVVHHMRDRVITVPAFSTVENVLLQEELPSIPLPQGEKLLLMDEETGCSLPRSLKIPYWYVSNISDVTTRRLQLCASTESVALRVALHCFSHKNIAPGGNAVGLTVNLFPPSPGTVDKHHTVRNFLNFFSWFPELSSAFSGTSSPLLAFGDSPLWLTSDVIMSHQLGRLKNDTQIRIGFDRSLPPIRKTITFRFGDHHITGFVEGLSNTISTVMTAVLNLLDPRVGNLFITNANGCQVEQSLTMNDVYGIPGCGDEIVFHLKSPRIATETFDVVGGPSEQLKTITCSVSVKGMIGSRSKQLAETATVDDIIRSCLDEFQVVSVDARKCSLSVSGSRVLRRDRKLSELMKMQRRVGSELQLVVVRPST